MSESSFSADERQRQLADLMVAYQRGDPSAFEQLYALLAADVRGYFFKVHPDRGAIRDLVQETFLELHRARRTYMPPLPVRPWVFGIARNVSARTRRAAYLQPRAESSIDLHIGMPMFWAWRAHVVPLTTWPSWVLSAIETGLSLAILAAAFREAIPGRELSTRTLFALVSIAGISFLLLNPTQPAAEPISLDITLHWIWRCVGMALPFSIPALALPSWLVSSALPNRPALAGALSGLGIGLMADAGLRLLCWNGTYLHVVAAHGGSIVIPVLLGALSATLAERAKIRR